MNEGDRNLDSTDSAPSPEWEAIARHLAGEASTPGTERIESLLAASPQDRALVTALDTVISAGTDDIPRDLDVDGALGKVKARRDAVSGVIPLKPRSRWRIPMPALAAAALFAVVVASMMTYRNRPVERGAKPASRMLATGVGIRDSLTLTDGTRVILGPMSSVTVEAGYGEKTRGVEIRGDAWFDVVHDSRKPFTVHAGNAAIVDVGTTFVVRSDSPDGVAVSVSTGSVSLRHLNSPARQGVILKAGDVGILDNGGQVIARRGMASEDDVAWMQGRLVFHDASLGEVIASMRKWYGIEIQASDSALAGRHLTATFAGESADRALEVIRLALGVDVIRHGDTAVVRPSKGSVR
jgi:transmembrane sensor